MLGSLIAFLWSVAEYLHRVKRIGSKTACLKKGRAFGYAFPGGAWERGLKEMNAVLAVIWRGFVPRSQAPPGNAYLKALPYTPKTGAIQPPYIIIQLAIIGAEMAVLFYVTFLYCTPRLANYSKPITFLLLKHSAVNGNNLSCNI